MDRTTTKCLLIVVAIMSVIHVAVILSGPFPAWASGNPPPDQVIEPSSAERVSDHFRSARRDFLRGNPRGSASEVRKASALLATVQSRSGGTEWESLSTARARLDVLADALQERSVHAVDELDRSFAVAERALAGYYEERASQSRTTNELADLAQYLKAAATHLENAFQALIEPLDRETKAAIEEARRFGEKLTAGQPAADAEKILGVLRTGINKVDKRIEGRSTVDTSAIRVLPKPTARTDLVTAIINVARQSIPAVVYIEVTESKVVGNPLLPFENDPFFQRFFGVPDMPRKFKEEKKGLGSGIIIDPEGYILTNYHVAGSATKMEVTLADGSRLSATLVGVDPKTDLAVIKVSPPGPLPRVAFGDSDRALVGEWVIAIGVPRALEKTVTQGIISAKHRTGITEPTSFQDFLQTDAAMNPGNSGGPLLNLYGQVIGVNAAISTSSGGSEGIGFTIPSNMAVYVAKALISHGKVERGWLGVTTRDLTPALARSAHAEGLKGALILGVMKGAPADKAGVTKDDVVIGFNGQDVSDSTAFRNAVSETEVGQTAKITLLRNGKRQELEVRIGSENDEIKAVTASLKAHLGAEVRQPTSGEVERYGLTSGVGVMISSLDPGGPLGQAGIEKGDGVLAVDDQPVPSPDVLAGIVNLLKPGEKVSVMVLDHRTGATGTVPVVVR